MSEHEQDKPGSTSIAQREDQGPITNLIMGTIGGATRLGINLATLPLGLLPERSRGHMHNAIRELSYAFAQLPRDFSTIAADPIEEWISAEDRTAAAASGAAAARAAAPAAPAATAPSKPQPAATAPPPPAATAAPQPVASAPAAARPAPPPATPPAASTPPPATPPATPPAASTPPPATPPATPPAASTPSTPSAAGAPAEAAAPAPDAAVAQDENRGPQAKIDKSASGSVEIAFIEYNPSGSDLLGEYVLLRNSGTQAIDMKGWRLIDDAGNTFVFPTFRLAPAAELRVWTKKGKNGASDLYWGRTTAAWNNTGDTALLKDSSGNEVARYHYEVPKTMRRR